MPNFLKAAQRTNENEITSQPSIGCEQIFFSNEIDQLHFDQIL